ncbi:MAG: N-acetyltransferase family protein [Rhizobiaceae bacterium]
MTIFIRSAHERDLPAISKLLGETWHATYDAIYGVERVAEITVEWHSVAALKDNLAKPHSEFILADTGDRILGMAYASMVDGETAMLHQLYVHPAGQGSGTGTLLLEEIIGCFPGAQKLRLEVEEANSAAVAFYKRQAFKQVGQTSNCGKADSGIPALIFEKSL